MALNEGWDWRTHLPVIKFLVNEYTIRYCMEHGTGVYSTPILLNGSNRYEGIEEDEIFYHQMLELCIYSDNNVSRIILPDEVQLFTRYSDLEAPQQAIIQKLYKGIETHKRADNGFNILFVDGFTGTRNVCINTLYNNFDFIVYHDAEPNSKDVYEYDFCTPIKERFTNYLITTPISHTGLLVRNGIEINLDALRKYIDDFCFEEGMQYEEMDILNKWL